MEVDQQENAKEYSRRNAVLVTQVEKKLINNEKLLKEELDKILGLKVKEVKPTSAGNIIVLLDDEKSTEILMKNTTIFPKSKKILLDQAKKATKGFKIVIKVLSMETAQSFGEELKSKGVTNISQFSKKTDYKMIKAECGNEESMSQLINNGILFNYRKYKVEKYVSPVKPTQCFNCQKFGHFAAKCEQVLPSCVRCGGEHRLSECQATEVKCANCKQQHTSSYGGCREYQKHLKEKTEIIKKKTEKLIINKQYSQVLKTNISSEKINFEEIKKSIETNIVETIESTIEATIKKALENQLNSIIETMKDTINQAVSQQLNNFMKSQEQYINVKMEEIKKSSDTYIVTKTEEYKNYLDQKLEENTESIKNQSKNIITRLTYVLIDVVKSLFPNQKLN
jgi:hypothetical protein